MFWSIFATNWQKNLNSVRIKLRITLKRLFSHTSMKHIKTSPKLFWTTKYATLGSSNVFSCFRLFSSEIDKNSSFVKKWHLRNMLNLLNFFFVLNAWNGTNTAKICLKLQNVHIHQILTFQVFWFFAGNWPKFLNLVRK